MTEVAERPALSVLELVLLFDDYPTVPLVTAICEQVNPTSNRDLLHAMFLVPVAGPLPTWFAGRLTNEQSRMIDLGLSTWREQHHSV